MTEHELCAAVEKHDPGFVARMTAATIDWKILVSMAWAILGPLVKQYGPAQIEQLVAWVVAYIDAWLRPAPLPTPSPTPDPAPAPGPIA